MEDLVAPPLEEHNHKDSSHISIKDQAQEEDPQIHEEEPHSPMEDLEYESTHASISAPHEVKGLVGFAHSQIYEFGDLPYYDLENKLLKNDELEKTFTCTFDEGVDHLLNHGVNSMYHEDMHHHMLPSQRLFGFTGQFLPPTHIFVNGISSPLRGIIM
jgi:hypothetical protein